MELALAQGTGWNPWIMFLVKAGDLRMINKDYSLLLHIAYIFRSNHLSREYTAKYID